MSESAVNEVLKEQRPMDYNGRSIGPLRLARAMTINIIGGSSVMAALAVLWPNATITIIFLREHLGASKAEIGLNLTLVTIGTLAALPGAWLFSHLQRRRETWLVLTVLARAFMFGPALVALLAFRDARAGVLYWVFVGCLLLVHGGSVFTSSGWWSWMADLIPDSIRGSFFGLRFRWMLAAQSLVALLAGALLDYARDPDSERLMFFAIFLAAATLAVLDPLLFAAVPEPVRPQPPRRTVRELAREYSEPIRDRAFRGVLIGSGAYGFFLNLPMVFIVLFLRGEQVGGVWIGGRASLKFLSLVVVVFAAATALAADAWGRLSDRIGHRAVWILSSLGYFTHVLFFFVNEETFVWLALVNSVLHGALFAGYNVASQNMALSMAPPSRREFYISMFQAVIAMAGAFGPVLGGWLADQYRVIEWITLPSGQHACYIHLLFAITFVGILLTLPIMVRVPDSKGTAVLPWFGRMLSGDLLRTAWSLGVLSTSSSAPRRVRALRRISHRDGNTLLPEISTALDDPDLATRREALLALGRLGTPEALDLLRWYLHEPDAALRAPSVEAVGRSSIPDRGSLLKRALRDPDGRVRRAAAEAVGWSGDREAADELRHLLTDEEDGEVLVSAALALSRLKEFGAVREMVNVALKSANTTVRAQMLVALADLLSGTSEFNRLWRQDRHWRGVGFAKLAKKLRRQARVLARRLTTRASQSWAERRDLIAGVDAEVEQFLEHVQAEDWRMALSSLRRLARELLRLRYGYQGDEAHAVEFLCAVAPGEADRYWLVSYLHHISDRGESSEAPWDGLTLLALHVIVHGQPMV